MYTGAGSGQLEQQKQARSHWSSVSDSMEMTIVRQAQQKRCYQNNTLFTHRNDYEHPWPDLIKSGITRQERKKKGARMWHLNEEMSFPHAST